jgi:hypothetical protein
MLRFATETLLFSYVLTTNTTPASSPGEKAASSTISGAEFLT